MSYTPSWRIVALASLGALLAIPAAAQDSGYTYGGLSIGRSHSRIDDRQMGDAVLAPGISTTDLQRDARATAWRLFGGYQMTPNLALELGFFDLGKFRFRSDTTGAGTLAGQIQLQGANLDLVGKLPLTQNLSALGRIGATYTRSRDRFSGTGAGVPTIDSASKRSTNLKLGAGLEYEINPSFLVRAEAERLRVDDAVGHKGNVNLWSVSMVFPFGRTAQTRAAMAPAYVPMAAAEPTPAPAPVVVVAPVPEPIVAFTPVAREAATPERRSVSYAAESVFTFDRAEVRPEGEAALTAFANELAGTDFEMINVHGHADRLGTTEYNQTLSMQRAEAVKSYLVTRGKLDPAKISAVGRSEAEPVTMPEDCKGQTITPALVQCLQPDRRVHIEVVGSRPALPR